VICAGFRACGDPKVWKHKVSDDHISDWPPTAVSDGRTEADENRRGKKFRQVELYRLLQRFRRNLVENPNKVTEFMVVIDILAVGESNVWQKIAKQSRFRGYAGARLFE
jgi:hypothetical protein